MIWQLQPSEFPRKQKPGRSTTKEKRRVFRRPLWLSPESEWLGFFTSDMLHLAEQMYGPWADLSGKPSIMVVSPRKGGKTPLREIDESIWNERAASRFHKLGQEVPNTPDRLRGFMRKYQLIGPQGIRTFMLSIPLAYPEDTLVPSSMFATQLQAFRAFRWHVPRLFDLVDMLGDGAAIFLTDERISNFLSLPDSTDARQVLGEKPVQEFFVVEHSEKGTTITPRPFESLYRGEDEQLLDVLLELAGPKQALFKGDRDFFEAQRISIETLFEMSSRGLLLIEGVEEWGPEAFNFFIEIA